MSVTVREVSVVTERAMNSAAWQRDQRSTSIAWKTFDNRYLFDKQLANWDLKTDPSDSDICILFYIHTDIQLEHFLLRTVQWHFKNAYHLLNLRAFHIWINLEEFLRYKIPHKCPAHALRDVHFLQRCILLEFLHFKACNHLSNDSLLRVMIKTLQWRHNECDGHSIHWCLYCLLTICSGANQRKHQNSTSLAFVRGINRWPVNFWHKGPVTWKMFQYDDVIMEFPSTGQFVSLPVVWNSTKACQT